MCVVCVVKEREKIEKIGSYLVRVYLIAEISQSYDPNLNFL